LLINHTYHSAVEFVIEHGDKVTLDSNSRQ